MTKRSLTVIAVLILLPVLVTLIVCLRWKNSAQVIAEYGDNIDTIYYGKLTLREVKDNESYMAEPGVFLGKVGDRLLGAGLYTLKYDTTGKLWAIVSEKGTVIYTESGTLPPSAYGGERVTRIFFDRFSHPTDSADRLEILESVIDAPASSAILWTPDTKQPAQSHDVHLCYDGSPVSTVTAGRFLYVKDSGRWFFLSAGNELAAQESYAAGETEELTYSVIPVTSSRAIRLLKTLFLTGEEAKTAENSVSSAAE